MSDACAHCGTPSPRVAADGCVCDVDVHLPGRRVAELAALKPGWLDGRGMAIAPVAIDRARAICEAIVKLAPERSPHVYPTSQGGVHLEWDVSVLDGPGWAASMEIAADGQAEADATRLDLRSTESSEPTLPPDANADTISAVLVEWLGGLK